VGSSLPKVVHGYRDAGVALGSAPVSIGQLDLVPGIWWIRATANLVRNVDGEDFEAVVTCSLATRDSQNGPTTEVDLGRSAPVFSDDGPETPVFEMTHAFGRGSAALVRLSCHTSDGTVDARHVRVRPSSSAG
jgi:hypothetical protein